MAKKKNSVKSIITKEDIINEVRMTLASDTSKKKAFVIVEGEDDSSFLRKHVDNNIEIKESFSGCKGVDEIIKQLNEIIPHNPRFIGIKDRDYGKLLDNNRIFYYDYNNLEVFLISSDDVLKSICSEYYRGDSKSHELRVHMLEELLIMGIIRKISFIDKWGLKLDCISINNAYNKDLKKIDKEYIQKEINRINSQFFDKYPEKLEKINSEVEKINENINYEDLLNLIQGHDLLFLFKRICDDSNNLSKGLNVGDIASSMRCSYSIDEFKNSNLYKNIKAYESNHKIKIFN